MLSWVSIPAGWLFLGVIQKHPPAENCLKQKLGVTLSPGVVFWETKRINSQINLLGELKSSKYEADNYKEFFENVHSFLDSYYVFGIVVFFILQVLLLILLISGALTCIYRALNSSTINEVADAAVLRPVVPGVNMAVSEFPLLGFTLVLTLSFHELGHAIAAATEKVRTEGVGLFFALVVPGAYVRLEEGLLPQLPPRAQLKVYCAGAWHNLILALFAFASSKALPFILSPLYEAQPITKTSHGNIFKHHRHHNKRHAENNIESASGLTEEYQPHKYHHVKHDGLALDLSPYSPFYQLLGKPDDSLVALDDYFITSYASMIDVINKIDARASFATPFSLFNVHQQQTNLSSSPIENHGGSDNDEQVVQLQGVCLHPEELVVALHHGQHTESKFKEGHECFVMGGNMLLKGNNYPSSSSDSDSFVKVCRRTTSMIEKAKLFAQQVYEDDDKVVFSNTLSPHNTPCKHCKKQSVFTCSRSLDCPRVVLPTSNNEKNKNEKNSLHVKDLRTERGSCARALLAEGESLVTVHLASGKSLAWRGDVVRDGLSLALTPAAMRLRPFVSVFVKSVFMKLDTLVHSFSASLSMENEKKEERLESRKYNWNGDIVNAWLVRFPSHILAFLSMLSQVSISIALLNILPIYCLDGHLASVQFIRLWLLSAPPPAPPTALPSNSHRRPTSVQDVESDSTSSVSSNIINTGGAFSRSSSGGGSNNTLNNITGYHHHHHNRPQSPLSNDDPEFQQLLRDRYHDWNALHMRQTRYTWYLLGSGTFLVLINFVLGGIALFG